MTRSYANSNTANRWLQVRLEMMGNVTVHPVGPDAKPNPRDDPPYTKTNPREDVPSSLRKLTYAAVLPLLAIDDASSSFC